MKSMTTAEKLDSMLRGHCLNRTKITPVQVTGSSLEIEDKNKRILSLVFSSHAEANDAKELLGKSSQIAPQHGGTADVVQVDEQRVRPPSKPIPSHTTFDVCG